MKKILTFLLVAAASLGAFFALGGCGLTGRSSDTDCVDGGVTRRHNYDAPKVIHSAEIVALDTNFFLLDWEEGGYSQGGRHWAFSVRREGEASSSRHGLGGRKPAPWRWTRPFCATCTPSS